MKIFPDIEQRTPEWYAIRKTVFVTASELGMFHANANPTTKTEINARLNFISKKLAEPIYDDASLSGAAFLLEMREKDRRQFDYNIPVQRGNALEAEARELFCKMMDMEAQEVGFIADDDNIEGLSPDALLFDPDDNAKPIAGLELKCPIPETHIKYLLAGTLPDEYRCQVHGSMGVVGLPWYFASFCPGLPMFIVKVEPDKFTAEMSAGIKACHKEFLRIGSVLKRKFAEANGKELV